MRLLRNALLGVWGITVTVAVLATPVALAAATPDWLIAAAAPVLLQGMIAYGLILLAGGTLVLAWMVYCVLRAAIDQP